jgi:uncharacterized protein YwqG
MDESPVYDELKAEAITAIRNSVLAEHAAILESWITPAIGISLGDNVGDSEIRIGASKTGGQPDLPPDFPWPYWQDEPLTFIAQFNLAEIAPFDVEEALPKSGLLSFWSCLRPVEYDNFTTDTAEMHGRIGNYPDTYGSWRVIHLPDSADLQRTKEPVDIPHFAYAPQPIEEIRTWVSMPDTSSLEVSQLFDVVGDDDEYYYLLEEIDPISVVRNSNLHLLGHAWLQQDDERWMCEKVSSGFAYDGLLLPQQKLLMKKNAHRWRLLLQLSSNEDMSWAGDGYGYFHIPSEELKAQRWEKAWFNVQR